MSKSATQAVIFDIGGVLLDGNTPMPGAVAALARLREADIPFLLLTNTTRRSHADLLANLHEAGLNVSAQQLLTPARAAAEWLQSHQTHGVLLIHPGLLPDFAGVDTTLIGQKTDTTAPRAVIIGDAGEGFNYTTLNAAFRELMAGATLISLSDSRYFREADGLSLDAGPFVRLLENAAGVTAIAMGKPGASFFRQAIAALGFCAENITLIGDDVHSDIQGAHAVGMQTILVQTGKFQTDDARLIPEGTGLASDVTTAVDQLLPDS
ncbi:TIGR01458 family HAD-type hydrolase [Halothiobacillus sp.]|uniref:TIGR01458 family HAD-type hydrolase n=1 Tax=Halothiobacillus sp. TaxID=1891311 RepID=UPI003D138AA8